MTSKILVKLPTVPFAQPKKPHPELVTVANRSEPMIQIKQSNGCGDRSSQLEQNMKFLQEQHQAILVALQKEVETLRQRNRDLQFQLVFSSNATNVISTPSSPDDSGGGFVKSKGSPVSVNVVSLQVELLERDIQDLRISLQEAETHNQYLKGIVDQQKKNLDLAANRTEKPIRTDIGVQVQCEKEYDCTELAARLEDAEAMVLCLRRENEDQRREIAAMKASSNKGGRYHGNNSHHNRGLVSSGSQDQKFPPLPTQSYWHNGSRGNNSFDHNSDHYHGRNRHDKQNQDSSDNSGGTMLPQLRSNTINKADSFNYPSSFHHKSRGYHNGSSYYRVGYRYYRGQRSQRDSKDREPREQNRDFKEKDSKEHPKEYKESRHVKDSKNFKEP